MDSDLAFLRDSFRLHPARDNLEPEEAEALLELRNNRDIIVKPADKSSAVVLMDREQYLWEDYRQLNNGTYYAKLDRPIYVDTVPIVSTIINTLWRKKYITHVQRKLGMGRRAQAQALLYVAQNPQGPCGLE